MKVKVDIGQLAFMYHHLMMHPELANEYGEVELTLKEDDSTVELTTRHLTDDGSYQVVYLIK